MLRTRETVPSPTVFAFSFPVQVAKFVTPVFYQHLVRVYQVTPNQIWTYFSKAQVPRTQEAGQPF